MMPGPVVMAVKRAVESEEKTPELFKLRAADAYWLCYWMDYGGPVKGDSIRNDARAFVGHRRAVHQDAAITARRA